MKYLRQLLMILIFSFIGEVLHAVIPIQMPASIYGLVLLFIALMTGLVKLPQVHEAARFLIEIMPLMFIPAGVGLIDSWGELRPILLPVIVLDYLCLERGDVQKVVAHPAIAIDRTCSSSLRSYQMILNPNLIDS